MTGRRSLLNLNFDIDEDSSSTSEGASEDLHPSTSSSGATEDLVASAVATAGSRNQCPDTTIQNTLDAGEPVSLWVQDSCPSHTEYYTQFFLKRWLGRLNGPSGTSWRLIQPHEWPSRSPDLNVWDYCFNSALKREVQGPCGGGSLDEVREAILPSWERLKASRTTQGGNGSAGEGALDPECSEFVKFYCDKFTGRLRRVIDSNGERVDSRR